VRRRNRARQRGVTGKSHSIPPRGLSICVYVTRPVSRATRLAQRRSRKSAAPAPTTPSFATDDSAHSADASLDLRDGRLVEERRRIAARGLLCADRGRPQLPRPSARPERRVTRLRVRLAPVRARPARLLPARARGLTEP